MANESTTAPKRVSFLAVNPYVERNIILPTEKVMSNGSREIVSWGDGNAYPDYLLDLYNSVATLRSIVNGCVDFTVGNDVTTAHLLQGAAMNRTGDTIRDLVKLCAGDYFRYGGFALQIIRNAQGEVAEINYIDLRFLRTNKECTVFYYSEKFGKKRSAEVDIYPEFMPNLNWSALDEKAREVHSSSILYVKNTHTQVYPAPLYAASVKACEIERAIDEFHLNAINNGFVSSAFFNFNNGVPDDEIREEIEKDITEKFTGAANAARIGCSWSEDKEHATEVIQFKMEDFGAQYEALAKHCRQQMFTAFRANPNLFGIPTESLGFSSEEYESAFALFNRTQIKPVQDLITDTFDKVFKEKNSITITPFTI